MAGYGFGMRIAVVDLGSNSFNLLVAEVGVDGTLVPLERQRIALGLAIVVASQGIIPKPVADRAVRAAARLFRSGRRQHPDRMVAVATSALREAANRSAIEARLAEAVPCGVRYLSGREEAALAFSAIVAAGGVGPSPILGADLGGGSLDIAAGRGSVAEWAATLPLGVGRLTATMRGDPPDPSERESLRRRIERDLEAVDPQLPDWLAVPSCAAAGGTARAIGRMVEATRNGRSDPRPTRVSNEELDALAARLWSLSTRDRRALPSIDRRRAEHLPMGAAVLAALCRRVGSGTLTISPWGLREGLALEAIGAEEAIPRRHAGVLPRSGEPQQLPA